MLVILTSQKRTQQCPNAATAVGPIFSMGVNVTRPTFNFEPRYRVIIPHREDWTKRPAAPPEVKGLVWYTEGSKMKGGPGRGSMGNL
jgi:hypothetical protein